MRWAALDSLLQNDEPDAIEAVNGIIRGESKHTKLREAAIQGVSERKRMDAVEALVSATGTGSKRIRCLAVAALSEIGDQRAVEPLIAALTGQDQHIDVR